MSSFAGKRSFKFLLFILIVMSFFVVHAGEKTAAATQYRPCGIDPSNNQGSHDFSGAIINTKWIDDDGSTRTSYYDSSNNPLKVKVEPVGTPYNDPVYGQNKIVKLDPNTNARVDSIFSGEFNTVDGCSLAWATVFGKTFATNGLISKSSLLIGTISNNWVLDCDASYWGLGNEQRFKASISNTQTPKGARSGGTWMAVTFRSRNGDTVPVELIYNQPTASNYEIRSNLVDNTNRSQNMQDHNDGPPPPNTVRYGLEGTGQHRIKVNGTDKVSNQTHYVSTDQAERRYSSQVQAPGTIYYKVNGNWVPWIRAGYSVCINTRDCRDDGPVNTGSEAKYDAYSVGNGRIVRVYWFYEPEVSPVTSCSLLADDDKNITINLGDSFTLDWSSHNADSFTIGQGIGSKTPNQNGSQSVTPSSGGTFTYIGTARKSGINYTCSATVTVVAPPPTCHLDAFNSSGSRDLRPNEAFTLYWTSENASSFTIDQGIGSKTPNTLGSDPTLRAPLTSGSKVYIGTVTASGQANVTCSATITVIPPPSCTLNVTAPGFTITPSGIVNVPSSTRYVTLTWTLTNAARIEFSQPVSLALGTKNSNGSQTVDLRGLDPITTFKATPYSSATGGTEGTDCPVTVNIAADQPYLKAFGNDVSVGSAFIGANSNCSINSTARIDAYVDDTLSKGAGTQFAAYAPSTIKGFLSAVTRQGSAFQPNSPNGLTFGNSSDGMTKTTPNITDYVMGGNSSTTRCIPNYIAMAEDPANASKVTNMGVNSSISGFLGTPSGTAVDIQGGVKAVTYRGGDLIIDRDIKYSTSWSNIADIPSVVIIVRGDIYIDAGVTTLDGIYIAAPRADGSGGTIYTCTNGASTLIPTYPTCNTKLTINGAFIANSVKFWRTWGTVSGAGINENSSSTNIAEVFNFSPEIYVGQMPELFKRTTAKKNYDYITSLPPTL